MTRRLLPLGALAVAILLAATLTAGASSGPPRCRASALHGHLGRIEAGAGSRWTTLVLRNVSARSCRMRGYARLQLLRRHGREIPTHRVRDRSQPVHLVVLAPGDRAFAQLRWGAIPAPDEPQSGPCERTARRLAVTPPGRRHSLTVRWRGGPVCEHGRILLRPVTGTRPAD